MKRLLFLIILGFYSSLSIAETFDFGIRAGIISAKIKSESNFGLSGTGGMFFRMSWGDFYLEPALDYSHITTKIKENGRNQARHYASLSIPILTGYYLLNKPKLKVRIFGGLSFTFPCQALTDDLSSYYDNYDRDEEGDDWAGGAYMLMAVGSKAGLNANVGAGIDIGRRFVLDTTYQEGRFRGEKQFHLAHIINVTVGIKLHAENP